MSTEHIRFITVGFAELLANLPDPDDAIASEPELADYWPDDLGEACAWCGEHVESGAGYYQASGDLLVFCDHECHDAYLRAVSDAYDGPLTDDD